MHADTSEMGGQLFVRGPFVTSSKDNASDGEAPPCPASCDVRGVLLGKGTDLNCFVVLTVGVIPKLDQEQVRL